MEIGEYGYEKPELVRIAEQIYSGKSRKKALELELSSEQYHLSYVPQRKELKKHEMLVRSWYIIPVTIGIVISIIYIVYYLSHLEVVRQEGFRGVVLLMVLLYLIFGGYTDYCLIKRELFIMNSLLVKREIHKDEKDSKAKIQYLEKEIKELTEKISKLESKQHKLIDIRKSQNNLSPDEELRYDEKREEFHSEFDFTLRQVNRGEQDMEELKEFYIRKEKEYQEEILHTEEEIQNTNRNIVQIDEDFESTKKLIALSVLTYIVAVLVQSIFSGVLYTITCIMCILATVVGSIILERKCKKPILRYLIEHDSPLTVDYAFCNDLYPVYKRKNDLQQTLTEYRLELQKVKNTQTEIAF